MLNPNFISQAATFSFGVIPEWSFCGTEGEISSRILVSDSYKYGYIGLGKDNEISANSKHLNRSQLNYYNDKTLALADPGSTDYGGYRIPSVEKFGCVYAATSALHPCKKGDNSNHNMHFDSKTYFYNWSFLEALDSKFSKQNSTKAIWLDPSDLKKEDIERIEDCDY